MGPLGTDKALLAYHGRTFLASILATLREAGVAPVAVVLGHHADQIRQAVNLEDAEVVINRGYRHGQTSSLQAGLKALRGREPTDLEGIVLCLVDHPAVSADTVRTLVGSSGSSGAPVVIPTYEGQRGHPVLIGRALFDELLGLGPAEGANTVVRKYRQVTQFLEVTDPGILVDVDDPATYQKLNQP